MEFENVNEFSNDNFEYESDFKEVLKKYLIYFKWFIVSIVFFLMVAYLYVRVQAPKYYISATILIKDKEKGGSFADLSDFESLGLYGSGDNLLENEIQILQSRRLMTKVVEELKLNIKYFIVDSPYDKEQYPDFPLVVKADADSIKDIGTKFEIFVTSDQKFEFIDFDGEKSKRKFNEKFSAQLGNKRQKISRSISVELNKNFPKDLVGERILVEIFPINAVVTSYIEKIKIVPVNDKISNVLTISVNENIKNKGISFITNLIEQYNTDRINDENITSQGTTKFLDERLALISSELVIIESTAAQFRAQNKMLNDKSKTEYYLESSTNNENKVLTINTQMQLVNYTLDELSKSEYDQLLPINIGLDDNGIVQLINQYNELILKRNRILKSSSVKNPIVEDIDSNLFNLKNNLSSSLSNAISSLQIQADALSKQGGRIDSDIAAVPINEREYNEIIRKQKTKNELYIFLLQKREESILSNAVGVEKSKIINSAYSEEEPISPKKGIIYFGALLLGLLTPAMIIYITEILDTKVHNEKDLGKLHAPYLGDVPLSDSKKEKFIRDSDNSNIAEAFRYVRTNLNFMLDENEKGKTIFVTSTLSGEGKTLTAINLATSLAISGKKTVLLGMDLRVSKITDEMNLEEILGVTNFIKNENLTLEAITETYTNVQNLSVINSGDTPPNPVELLMSNRVNQLFKEIKEKYEYVVVDTAPVGLVTDTIQIGKYSDLTIYVVRANFLDKKMLHIPKKLSRDKKLPNMALLINGSEKSKGTYGYGYGYSKVSQNKTLWGKIVNLLGNK